MPYADPDRNREYHRDYNQRWNEKNPERRREISQAHDRRREGTTARHAQRAEVRTRRHIRQRVAVIERYGGQCAFCGTTQYEHLTIDHVNGDGGEHRAAMATQYRGITDYLYRTEFRPDLYRVLCWNCHMAMTRYGVRPDGESLHDMEHWRTVSALRYKERS